MQAEENTDMNQQSGAEEIAPKPSGDSTVLAPGTSEGDSSAAEQAKGEGAAAEVKEPWWKFW